MPTSNAKTYDFEIKIDYDPKRKNPAAIFETIAEIIDSFYQIDKDLLDVYLFEIEPTYVLENIELGSIKARIRALLESIDDDGLKALDWKKLVGSYLVKGKHKLLKKFEDKDQITTLEEIKEIEEDLKKIADESNVPTSGLPLKMNQILTDINKLVSSTQKLSYNESVSFIHPEGEIRLNRNFSISLESIEELLTSRTVEAEHTTFMPIKKPDYIGKSKWIVYLNNRLVDVKILDLEWLERFQSRKIDIRPGDSLKGLVRSTIKFGHNNEIISEYHNVLKIYEVVEASIQGLQMDIEDFNTY